jgi:tellurite resistance protein
MGNDESVNTAEIRDKDTRFKPGNPGKPRGARHRITQLTQNLMESEVEEVVRSVIDAAKGGDMTAARVVIERILPARKSRTVNLDLPKIQNPDDVVQAMSAVVAAVADGEIDPDEAETVARVIEVKRRSLETANLEERIKALENGKKG